ncbi:aminotransferase class IV [Cyclobacterium qasimii]|uniref:branched-chain-amino-acid transaminase n=2 Tax=Cyclobacterium qasimii TaxID=1350429 RepID=S7WRW4_9BACT|nr:aminotransferase class IV [Cyclobacterium qasimii]EPR66838.1 Branched-chain amino acid aminotransferase [Cyclobacterium qasimii M12-11B]GEO22887.1 aminotransferase class IV [Cyclobacterium qasimii]
MVKGTHQALHDARNETVKIFINGEFFVREEAKISVFDSGYLVGDGVWEAFRVHGGKLLFIDQHLDRLWQSAKVIGIKLPFSREELIKNIHNTLEVNGMKDHVHVRAMITRGIKKTPSQDPRLTISGPNLVIIAEYKEADGESKNQGISLFTSAIRRGSPDYLDPRLNCHSKLHEVQALIQAIEAGADEALMLDINGFVSTCNATNFFMVKGDEVWTSTGAYCMNGITRGNVIKVCAQNGIVCHQKNFSLFDVYGADEAFVTGTFGGLTPVVKIDGKPIGNGGSGPVTTSLRQLYEGLVAQQLK